MNPHSSNELFLEDAVHFRDYWHVLVKHRTLILAIVCASAITTAVFALRQPDIYQSQVTLVLLSRSGHGLRASLGELGKGLLPGTAWSSSPSDSVLSVLKSHTLAENVIHRLGLLPLLFASAWDANEQRWKVARPPTLQDAVRELKQLVAITPGVTGTISITVEHPDPVLAAAIAMQYVDVLQHMLNDNAFSLAKKNRFSIAAQLQNTQKELVIAEETLRNFEREYGIVALDAQTASVVNAIAALEGQIMAKEVQLGVLQRSMTKANREVYLLQEELQELRAQLVQTQRGTSALPPALAERTHNHRTFPSLDKAPEIKLRYARLQRQVLMQTKLFTLLAEQLEQVKIDEARDETAFQLLDRAVPSRDTVRPQRRQSVIVGTVVGTFLGIFVAFFCEYCDPTVRTAEQVRQQLGLVLLATIPTLAPRGRQPQGQGHATEAGLGLSHPLGAPLVEALRYLHIRLQHLQPGHDLRTVLLTSAGSDEHTALVLANLAAVAASTGKKTLLVDSNVRQPVLHRLLHCPLVPGLADMLADPERWQAGVQTTSISNLSFIPSGTPTTINRTSFVESPALDVLLAKFKATFDLVLFATPPVLGYSDTVVLSSKVDAACLLLAYRTSRIEDVVTAKATLEEVGSTVAGAVLTGVRA